LASSEAMPGGQRVVGSNPAVPTIVGETIKGSHFWCGPYFVLAVSTTRTSKRLGLRKGWIPTSWPLAGGGQGRPYLLTRLKYAG
jgi:hypothetical protein